MKTIKNCLFVPSLALIIAAALALTAHADDYGTPIAGGTAIVTHPDVTVSASATLVCPANVNHRLSAIPQNTGTTNGARCGDANVSATQGVLITAGGGSASLSTSSPVYCYSASGTTLGCTEVLR